MMRTGKKGWMAQKLCSDILSVTRLCQYPSQFQVKDCTKDEGVLLAAASIS